MEFHLDPFWVSFGLGKYFGMGLHVVITIVAGFLVKVEKIRTQFMFCHVSFLMLSLVLSFVSSKKLGFPSRCQYIYIYCHLEGLGIS